MIRKLLTVALAIVAIATTPVLLTGSTTEPTRSTLRAAVQPAPEPQYAPWSLEPATGPGYSNIDWATMNRCWHDRFDVGGAPPRPGCTGNERLAIGCHWTVNYPSRYWVEQACGRIASWPAHFGHSWWRGEDARHPAARWVANLRAGGQP